MGEADLGAMLQGMGGLDAQMREVLGLLLYGCS